MIFQCAIDFKIVEFLKKNIQNLIYKTWIKLQGSFHSADPQPDVPKESNEDSSKLKSNVFVIEPPLTETPGELFSRGHCLRE